jgi:hypothetical protein
MNQDAIKEMLLELETTSLDFSVTFTGKTSKKVNGLYKPDTFEILLHNKNFTDDNQLVYTAIHEYAHHLEHEKRLERLGGKVPGTRMRFHTTEFWAHFHHLLDIAEQKEYYKLDRESPAELSELTVAIQGHVEQNGASMRALGDLLIKAQKMCEQAHIRYEDYIDRVLKIPRNAARAITKIAEFQVNPAIGYENMKFVASIPSPQKRKTAEEQFLAGKTPDMVRGEIKKPQKQPDLKTQLEQEKRRLEKTIETLSKRLKQVEENLANA